MVYNLNEILEDEELFNAHVKKCFENFDKDYNKFKEKYIKVKIFEDVIEMYYPNFLTNLIFLKPFMVFKEELDPTFVWFQEKWVNINGGSLNTVINDLYKFFKDKADLRELKIELAHIQENLEEIAMKYSIMEGLSISIIDKYNLNKICPEYWDLLHTDIPSTMSFNEIENYLDERTEQLLEIFKTYPNDLQIAAKTGTGLNKGQLQQMEISIGNVASIDGKILPKTINTNFWRGLKDRSDYYAESLKGKTSGIINYTVVEEAGYLNRKLTLLCMNTLLVRDSDDCGTEDTYSMYIDSINTLKRYKGRYYKPESTKGARKDKSKKVIDITDAKLIGKTLKFYTPVKCIHEDGYVCDKCYGTLAKEERSRHIGIKGVNNLTEKLTQRLLSSKHILKTVSEIIKWSKTMKRYFMHDLSEIYIKTKYTEENYQIQISDLDIIEEYDESDAIYINTFYVKTPDGETKKIISEKILRLDREVITNMKYNSGEYTILTKNLDPDVPLFSFTIDNNQLSKPLKDLIKLIESKDHMECSTIDEFMRKFMDLLNEANIKLKAIDAEIILRNLVRSPYDLSRRPLFDNPEKEPEYNIMALKSSIMELNSLVARLVFEDVKKQLLTPSTYSTDGIYLLDPFFLNVK